jgi:hypothetical protein
MKVTEFQWNRKTFPTDFDFVLKLRDKPNSMNGMLGFATGLKTVTLICEAEGTTSYAQLIRETPVVTLDLRKFKPTPSSDFSYFARNTKKLVSVLGALDLSNCTNVTNAFSYCSALENIEFVPNTIPISISFSDCKSLTRDSLMSMVNGLKDLAHIEYDITDNPLYLNIGATNGVEIYTINEVDTLDPNVILIYADAETSGKRDVMFTYKYSQALSEEIIDTFKVGTKFEVDYDTTTRTIKSFKIISKNENVITQTLTLGTTNLHKLTDKEKQIATEKGWTLL